MKSSAEREWVPWLVPLFMIVAGGALFYFMSGSWRAAFIVCRWTPTPCSIVSRTFATGERGAAFRYRFQGRPYEYDRFRFDTIISSGRSYSAALARRYPIGSGTTCYVNPLKPSVAVIERSLKPAMLPALIPLALLLFGALVLMVNVTELFRRPPETSERLGTPPPVPSSTPGRYGGLITGPIVLAIGNGVLLLFVGSELAHFLRGGKGFEPFDAVCMVFSVASLLWLAAVLAHGFWRLLTR